jgi:hypothetical protein
VAWQAKSSIFVLGASKAKITHRERAANAKAIEREGLPDPHNQP